MYHKVLEAFSIYFTRIVVVWHLAECNGELADSLRHPDEYICLAAEARMKKVIEEKGRNMSRFSILQRKQLWSCG